jgi:hypothetical protein
MHIVAGCFRGWARLLRPLYGVRKHESMNVWGCSICGRVSADIREDSHAHDGWGFDKTDRYCPECLESGAIRVDGAVDLEELRKKFLKKVHEIKCGGKRETN